MKSILRNRSCIAFLSVTCLPAQAGIIDTSTITVNASGFLNTIAGSGFINGPIVIPNNATLDYFSVELSGFTSHPQPLGLPQSLSLEFSSFEPSSTSNIYWNVNTGIFVGKQFTVNASENLALFNKLQGFVDGSGVDAPEIYSTMAWGFTGIYGNATASFLLTAHGDISPVPEPAPIWLVGAGLLSIFSVQRAKRVS